MKKDEALSAAPEDRRRIVTGVGAAIFRGDEVLIIQRDKPPLEGDWSIPGGRLEYGETLRAAIHREVGEETGCTVEIVDLLNIYEVLPPALGTTGGPGAHALPGPHLLMIDFACRWLEGEPVAGDDARAARFLQMNEALDLVSWDMTRRAITLAHAILHGQDHGVLHRPEEVAS